MSLAQRQERLESSGRFRFANIRLGPRHRHYRARYTWSASHFRGTLPLQRHRLRCNFNAIWLVLSRCSAITSVRGLRKRPGIYQINFQPSDLELREDIARLWQTEAFGVQKPIRLILSPENRKAMDILEKSIRHAGERQEVALMWKEETTVLPNNYLSAGQQLQHLSKRFKLDPAYGEKYNKVIQEYLSLGHAIPDDPSDTGTPGHVFYLPHHGFTSVNKPDKVRVVFNCSAQHNGISLIDMLHQCPDLLTIQVAVLLRFRNSQYRLPEILKKCIIKCKFQQANNPLFVSCISCLEVTNRSKHLK
jgi:hypothetical protein